MTKTARQAGKAFVDGRNLRMGNTRVVSDGEGSRLYLFGKLIASYSKTAAVPGVLVTFAGWPTPTTQNRLNGLLQALEHPERFYRTGGVMHFNGEPVDPEGWIKVANPWLTPIDREGLTIAAG